MTQWGLDTLFNPAKRHMDEEKRRLQATRQQVGDTSGGKRIDLESGKVRIKAGPGNDEPAGELTADAEAADASDAAEVADQPASPSKKKGQKGHKDEKDLTPAQLRAAQRRGRAPR